MRIAEGRLRRIIREALLKEEVYGKLAFIYTGSKSPPPAFLDFLANDRLEPGNEGGALYGFGLYNVYDLEGSNTEKGTYGEYIYKLSVNLEGYISFDDDVTEKIYGAPISPVEQAAELGLDRDVLQELERTVSENSGTGYSADIATPASKFLKGIVKGIVFTGREDGRVVVTYDAKTVRPVAYRRVDESQWVKFSAGEMSQFSGRETASWEIEKYEPNPITTRKRLEALLKQYRTLGSKMRPVGSIFKGDLDLSEINFEDLIPDLHVTGNMKMSPEARSLPDGLRVDGDLSIRDAGIKSLPRGLEVGGSLRTPRRLTHIRYPIRVGGDLDMRMTGVRSIPVGTTVGGDCTMSYSSIEGLPNGFRVGGSLDLGYSSITTLPSDLRVGGDLDLTGTGVVEIPQDARIAGRVIGLRRP